MVFQIQDRLRITEYLFVWGAIVVGPHKFQIYAHTVECLVLIIAVNGGGTYQNSHGGVALRQTYLVGFAIGVIVFVCGGEFHIHLEKRILVKES